jgi:hypothetical protein
MLLALSTSAFADRIQVVQGRRAVKDKVTFTIDVLRFKGQYPQYQIAPENIQIHVTFDQPTTGMIYVDGKALGRFDESRVFDSNYAEISYGRHTVTLGTTGPAVVSSFYITVNGGIVREFLTDEAVVPTPVSLEPRIAELERKVQDLEAEITKLKKQKPAGRKQ